MNIRHLTTPRSTGLSGWKFRHPTRNGWVWRQDDYLFTEDVAKVRTRRAKALMKIMRIEP